MAKTNSTLLILLLIVIIPMLSCKRSGAPALVSSYSFTWKGNNYEADLKVAHAGGTPYIMARVPVTGSSADIRIRIDVGSLAIGMYTFESFTNDSFNLVDENGILFKGDMVTLHISANSNNTLSGNFSGTVKDHPGYTSSFLITGYFTNIPIEN